MLAPVVPLQNARQWTIFHDDEMDFVEHGGGAAFTSRRVLNAWVEGDIFVPDFLWKGTHPLGKLNTASMSYVPNRRVLILDEAWTWKFPGECPQMNSAKDGRRVLESLLEGTATPAQIALYHGTVWHSVPDSAINPANMLLRADLMMKLYRDYCRVGTWVPDGRIDTEGAFRFYHPQEPGLYLTARGEIFSDPSDVLEETEFMLITQSAHLLYSWKPSIGTREAPGYLTMG